MPPQPSGDLPVSDFAEPLGLLIAFEGGDGAGKSTQIARLRVWLEDAGRRTVVTREPGGTPLGQEIRRLVLHGDDVEPRAEALLFAADRAHHVATVVRPAMEQGAVVLTDRYMDSSIAYQGGGRALSLTEVQSISLWATQDLRPDLTVLLDLDPVEGHRRRAGEHDRLESAGLEFHEEVRARFLELAALDPGRYLVVDAMLPQEQIAHQVALRAAILLEGAA